MKIRLSCGFLLIFRKDILIAIKFWQIKKYTKILELPQYIIYQSLQDKSRLFSVNKRTMKPINWYRDMRFSKKI